MFAAILVTDGAIYTVWGISLAIGLVVIAVVATLLTLIVRTARDIDDTAGDIWTVGQQIANNTVHIPLLSTTNKVVTGILVHASGINDATADIEAHARDCPG